MERANYFETRNLSFLDSGLPHSSLEFKSSRLSKAVTLRKQKRQENLLHKRIKPSSSPPKKPLWTVLDELNPSNLNSIKDLRKLLCDPKFDHYNLLNERPNIVDELWRGLQDPRSELSYEIIWCFTNLAAGPDCFTPKLAEYIPSFAELVTNNHNKMIAEQACWVLGNLAASNLTVRNSIRQVCGLLKNMAELLTFKIPSLNTVVCWTLSNLIRGSHMDVSVFLEAGTLEPVIELTFKEIDSDVFIEAIWFLSFLTNNPGDEVFGRLGMEVGRFLDILENSKHPKTIVACLRVFGNFFVYYSQIEGMLRDEKFFGILNEMFLHEETEVVRESLWVFSNILTSSSNYLQFFMQTFYSKEILRKFELFIYSDFTEIKTESAFCLYNWSISYFFDVIRSLDTKIVDFFLGYIENIPDWIRFEIQGLQDAEMLKISLDFIRICYENSNTLEIPESVHHRLQDSDIHEKIFKCQTEISKGRSRSISTTINTLCSEILKTN